MNEKTLNKILNELDDMKRLLILQLGHDNVKIDDIADALGVSKGTVSKLTQQTKYGKRKDATAKGAMNE